MKVAVYNRFLQSMGGGERHSSMLAQVLADDGHEVDLVGHEDVGKEIMADHLGLNLGKVHLRIVPDRGEPAGGPPVGRVRAVRQRLLHEPGQGPGHPQPVPLLLPDPLRPRPGRLAAAPGPPPRRPGPPGQARGGRVGPRLVPARGRPAPDLGLDQRPGRAPAGRRPGQAGGVRPGPPRRPRPGRGGRQPRGRGRAGPPGGLPGRLPPPRAGPAAERRATGRSSSTAPPSCPGPATTAPLGWR